MLLRDELHFDAELLTLAGAIMSPQVSQGEERCRRCLRLSALLFRFKDIAIFRFSPRHHDIIYRQVLRQCHSTQRHGLVARQRVPRRALITAPSNLGDVDFAKNLMPLIMQNFIEMSRLQHAICAPP